MAQHNTQEQWAQNQFVNQFFPGGMMTPGAFMAPYNPDMSQGNMMVPQQQTKGGEVPVDGVPYMTYNPIPVIMPMQPNISGQLQAPNQQDFAPQMTMMYPMTAMPVVPPGAIHPGSWVPVAAPLSPSGAPVMMYPPPVYGEHPGSHEESPDVANLNHVAVQN